MPIGRTNTFPESGRGLGHVTPTVFGSTVGYSSDSLASCLLKMQQTRIYNIIIALSPLVSDRSRQFCPVKIFATAPAMNSSVTIKLLFVKKPAATFTAA